MCAWNTTGQGSTSGLGGTEIERSGFHTSKIRHNGLNPILRIGFCEGPVQVSDGLSSDLSKFPRTRLLNTERVSIEWGQERMCLNTRDSIFWRCSPTVPTERSNRAAISP